MESEFRERAEFLVLAINHGLLEPDAAVDWACEIVVAEKDPLAVVVELAGLIRPQRGEVIELLDRVPGNADQRIVFRRVLGLMLQQLRDGSRTVGDVTVTLRGMVDANAVPEELAQACFDFDYALDFAAEGITVDTVDDVCRQVTDFLEAESRT